MIEKVNAWNGWDPLKQIIVGSIIDPEYFEEVKDRKLRHLLQKLLYETRRDMDNLKLSLEQAGVEVLSIPNNTFDDNPFTNFKNINEYYDKFSSEWNTLGSRDKTGIPKPLIAPRDHAITLGNTLHVTGLATPVVHFLKEHFKFSSDILDTQLIDGYKEVENKKGHPVKTKGPFELTPQWYEDHGKTDDDPWTICQTWAYDAPLVTRAGDKLIVDVTYRKNLSTWLSEKFPIYKQNHVAYGGHSDGIFCPIKPGHIITTDYETDYSKTFPGWDVHIINNPENPLNNEYDMFKDENGLHIKRWWTPENKENREYTNFIETWLNDWVGYAQESIFEVNMLVINPELVFCSNYNKGVFKYLESIGMTPHIVPFKHRWFWDSGLHCLTLDTYREGHMENYFDV